MSIPRLLQPHADRVDPDVYTFVGPCLDTRAHQGDWPAPGPDRPLVLVSLGAAYTDAPQFFRAKRWRGNSDAGRAARGADIIDGYVRG